MGVFVLFLLISKNCNNSEKKIQIPDDVIFNTVRCELQKKLLVMLPKNLDGTEKAQFNSYYLRIERNWRI